MKAMVRRSGEVVLAFCFALAFAAAVRAQQPATPPPSQTTRSAAAPQTAAEALARYEMLLSSTTDPARRFLLLTKATTTAGEAGEAAKAKAYARELLESAPSMRENWNYGNALHLGNLVLGRLALASGDVAEAKRLLLEAAHTPGSPQLNSFGPNMLLAKELLEKGEREAVVQYLDACAKFWVGARGRIETWKAELAQGQTPNFGPSLSTQLTSWRFEKWERLEH
jgi:hypothetical protein